MKNTKIIVSWKWKHGTGGFGFGLWRLKENLYDDEYSVIWSLCIAWITVYFVENRVTRKEKNEN